MFDFLPSMAVFVNVVESGSFSAAARNLNLSKSAVSKTISRLEEGLGTRLLNRTTRKLSLTEAGRSYYEGCRRMLNEAEAANQAVHRLSDAPRGTLRVNLPMSFGTLQVAPLLPLFLQRFPEIDLDAAFDDRPVDLVEEGYDMAIRIGVLSDSSLIARRLAPNRRVLCAAPSYLEEQGAPQSPEALAAHSCLLYSYQASGDSWRLIGPDGERRIRVSGRLRLNNGEAIRAAAVAGLGIAYLPTFIAGTDLQAGRLVPILPDWMDDGLGAVHAVYPAGRHLSPKVRVFIDFLAEHFGKEPSWDQALREACRGQATG
ncbi:MAG: LysR family transcriptional regulator [Pseudomonadota bacterium]